MKTTLHDLLASHRAAAVILALYLALATAYNMANPLFESPDEVLHFQFIRYLQQNHRLPVVDLEGPLTEFHQAPFYYTLAAVLTPMLPEETVDSLTQVNPFWGYNIGAVGDDNKNQYLHDPRQTMFGSPGVLTLHLLRAASTLFGAGTIVFTYLLAYRFLARSLAAAAMAIVAFTPNFLLTNSSITNDSPVVFLTVAAAYLVLRLTSQDEPPSRAAWAGLAALSGIGLLTKVGFWPLLPASALAITLQALRLRSWRLFIEAALILAAGVGLIGGWWLLRNAQLYQDMTALSAMWAVWGIRPPLTAADYAIELSNFRTTFWANFGYGNIPVPEWVYVLTNTLLLGGSVGLIFLSLRRWLDKRPLTRLRREQLVFLAVWVMITVWALLWYLQRTYSVTGRQLYAIFPVIALGLAAGWSALEPARWQTGVAWALASLMLVFAIGSLAGVLIPAYQPSPRLTTEAAQQSISHRLDWQIGDIARLVGYEIAPDDVEPGETAMVTLYWQPLRRVDENYTVFVHLFGEDGTLVGERNTYPGLGNDPTIYWIPGEVIVDRIPVPVDAAASGPILLDIEVGLYELDTGERLPIQDAAGSSIGYPVVGTVKLADPAAVRTGIPSDNGWGFANGTRLVSYELIPASPTPGEAFMVSLLWGSGGAMNTSYKVFVHLVDDEGEIITQADGIPGGGRYPTTAWGIGEHFEDDYTLTLPDSLPAGGYDLLVGFYDPATFARLELAEGGNTIRLEDAVIIAGDNAP